MYKMKSNVPKAKSKPMDQCKRQKKPLKVGKSEQEAKHLQSTSLKQHASLLLVVQVGTSQTK